MQKVLSIIDSSDEDDIPHLLLPFVLAKNGTPQKHMKNPPSCISRKKDFISNFTFFGSSHAATIETEAEYPRFSLPPRGIQYPYRVSEVWLLQLERCTITQAEHNNYAENYPSEFRQVTFSWAIPHLLIIINFHHSLQQAL